MSSELKIHPQNEDNPGTLFQKLVLQTTLVEDTRVRQQFTSIVTGITKFGKLQAFVLAAHSQSAQCQRSRNTRMCMPTPTTQDDI